MIENNEIEVDTWLLWIGLELQAWMSRVNRDYGYI